MNKTQKIISTVLFVILFCFGSSTVAMAGTDLGIIGLADSDAVSVTEAVEQGSEECLLFKTASGQTEYRLIVENVHAGTTSFNMAIYLNGAPNTVMYSHEFTMDDIKVTETLTLAPDTDYYIDLTNSVSSDSSVVPEVKITLEGSKAGPKADALTISKSTLLLRKGDKAALKADYTTDKADKSLTWISSDTKVAAVSSKGTVTAVNAGTAVITCTSKADNSLKAACKVTVVTDATYISISKGSASIEEGGRLTLTAAIKPSGAKNQPIIWQSSDKSIATVSDRGVVTGIKKGTVKITATVRYRSKNTVIAACNVTVKESKTKDISDVELTNGLGEDNRSITYTYAAGSCYAASASYTLKVGNYNGDLDITFKLTDGSDTRTISVVPDSTYYLTYTYSFKEDKGTIIKVPQYTSQWDPITKSTKVITTYTDSTIPAASTNSDLSVTVSGKICKNTVSAAGSFEKGEFTCKKK